jgi:hypothetical protein
MTPQHLLEPLRLMAAERATSVVDLIREALEYKVATRSAPSGSAKCQFGVEGFDLFGGAGPGEVGGLGGGAMAEGLGA